eukprot:jgi/Ulvmu1/7025/UM033_0084.1
MSCVHAPVDLAAVHAFQWRPLTNGASSCRLPSAAHSRDLHFHRTCNIKTDSTTLASFMRVHRACRRRLGYSLFPAKPASQHQSRRYVIRKGTATQHRCTQSPDVIHLGNLCLDVVLEVDDLPPAAVEQRTELLASLSARPPPKTQWKVGGGTNFMITASRLGLDVCSCGHVAQDDFGHHLMRVLMDEGITKHINLTDSISDDDPILVQTLVCFVLVHRISREHTFCSRYDFGPWPLLSTFSPSDVSKGVLRNFANTTAVMMNGFVFDELSPDVVSTLARHAHDAGAAVFFDPGPRCATLVSGSRRAAMEAVLSVVSVILVTDEELETLTGLADISEGCYLLFQTHQAVLQWVIVKLGSEGCILALQSTSGVVFRKQSGYKVEIADTVGCGDSFAAAIVMGYTRGWEPQVALALANAVGACTATKEGAGQNVASRDHVEALLQQGCNNHDSTLAQACWGALGKLRSQESAEIGEVRSTA